MGFLDGYYQKWHPYNDWKYDQWKANITSREGPQLKAGWGRPLSGGEPVYFGSEYDVFTPAGAKIKPEPFLGSCPDSMKIPGVYYDDPITGTSKPWKSQTHARIEKVAASAREKVAAAKKLPLAKAAKFAAGTLALGAVLPGEGVSNIVGAAGALGTYQYLKGSTGLKFGAAAAVYAVTKGVASLFSGRDDSYNTIEGLRHGGFAEQGRLGLTDFGSGVKEKVVNRAKNTLLRLFRGTEKTHAVQEVVGETISSYRGNRPAAEVFERIRRAEFPHRPSRYESTFWTPEVYIADSYTPKGGTLNVVDVEESKAFITSGEFWSEAVKAEHKRDMPGMEKAARKYWTGITRKEAKYDPYPEVLIPGKVTEHVGLIRGSNKSYLLGEASEAIDLRDISKARSAALEERIQVHNLQGSALGSNAPVNKIPGRDDSYNTIEGLGHGGMAGDLRKKLTEFGSGWDPLRKLANRMFGKGRGNAFKKMTKNKEFREALVGGEVIRELGEGLYGKAHLMEATYRGEKFQYVRKNIESSIAEKWAMFGEDMAPSIPTRKAALKTEYKALRRLSDRTSPTPYYYSKESSELYMEFMSGKTLNKMEEVPEHIVAKIRQEAEIAGKRGVFNPDIHRGNILYDEPTGRVAWLDFGLAQRRTRGIKKEEFAAMEEAISKKIVPPIEVKPTTPPPVQAAQAVPEEDFGDVMSAEVAPAPSRPIPVPPPNFPSRNKPFTPIPGKDDAYNEIEGLRHGGLAEKLRKKLTEFGSGWRGRYLVGAGAAAISAIGLVGAIFRGEREEQEEENKTSLWKPIAVGLGASALLAASPVLLSGWVAKQAIKKSNVALPSKFVFNTMKTSAKGSYKTAMSKFSVMKSIHFDENIVKEFKAIGDNKTFLQRLVYPAEKVEGAIEHTAHWLKQNWMPELKKFEPGAVGLAALSVYDAYHIGSAAYEGDWGEVATGVMGFAGAKYAYMGYYKFLRTPELRQKAINWLKKQKPADFITYGLSGLNSLNIAKIGAIEGISYTASYLRTGVSAKDYAIRYGLELGEESIKSAKSLYQPFEEIFSSLDDEALEQLMKDVPSIGEIKKAGDKISAKSKEAYSKFMNAGEEDFINTFKNIKGKASKGEEVIKGKSWLGGFGAQKIGSVEEGQMKEMANKLSSFQELLRKSKIPGKDDVYNTIEGLKHGGMAEAGRKARTEFGSGWKTDIMTFIKGELTAEEQEAVKYTPHRGVVAAESITSINKKKLSMVGKILADINAAGGKASKLLRESSYEVNRIPFEMAYNGGKRHRESAASRSVV